MPEVEDQGEQERDGRYGRWHGAQYTRVIHHCGVCGIIVAIMAAEESLSADQVTRQVEYWLELADYDLETARVMLTSGRLLYVGFMCHQVVEKSLKGVIVATEHVIPPYIHALVKLAKLAKCYDRMRVEDQALLDTLEPLNIEARYPAQKAVLMRSLTEERCRTLIESTEGVLPWIKTQCATALKSSPE